MKVKTEQYLFTCVQKYMWLYSKTNTTTGSAHVVCCQTNQNRENVNTERTGSYWPKRKLMISNTALTSIHRIII